MKVLRTTAGRRSIGRRLSVAAGAGAVAASLALAACGSTSTTASGAAPAASKTLVAQAKAYVTSHEGIDSKWTGPTTGPTTQPGKSIVVVASDLSNAAASEYAGDVKKAGEAVGWKVTVLDGQGTETGWVSAFQAAIARHPNGIVTDCDVTELTQQLDQAAAAHITVVGINAEALPQPYPKYHLFFNEEPNPSQIGRAEALYAIAQSDGKARVIILFDDAHEISVVKAEAMKAEIQKCATCKLLAYVSSPIEDVSTDVAPLATRWWSHYGKGTYVLTIADTYFDYAASTLHSIGAPPNGMDLVGSDGTASAYQRIRSGNYETVTVPEPWGLFGYQAIDELNRAFHGEKPSYYTPDIYLVTKSDVNLEGGKTDQFVPSDNYVQHYLAIWKPSGK